MQLSNCYPQRLNAQLKVDHHSSVYFTLLIPAWDLTHAYIGTASGLGCLHSLFTLISALLRTNNLYPSHTQALNWRWAQSRRSDLNTAQPQGVFCCKYLSRTFLMLWEIMIEDQNDYHLCKEWLAMIHVIQLRQNKPGAAPVAEMQGSWRGKHWCVLSDRATGGLVLWCLSPAFQKLPGLCRIIH